MAADDQAPQSPVFSVPGGVYTNDLKVELKAPSAVIRYSTDGSEPGSASAIYKTPVIVTNCLILRARAWYPNASVSPTVTQNYTLLADDLLGFSSNLPLLILDSCSGEIGPNEKSLAHTRIIAGKTTRVNLVAAADFDSLTLVNVRGHSSLRYPKHSFNIKVVNEIGDARKVSIFDLPKESDWVLYGPYPDKTFMRDLLAYELSNKMGRWAPRGQFVEVFVRENNNKLSMEHFAGLYVFEEKITRGNGRVNIAKLNPADIREPQLSGGYIFKKDHGSRSERKKFDAEGPPNATSSTNRSGYPTGPGGFPADPAGFLPPYVSKTSSSKPPKITTAAAAARAKRAKPPVNPNAPITNYVASAVPEGIRIDEETVFHENEYFRTTLQRSQLYYYDPEPDEITAVQRAWLKDYMNRFEAALYRPDFTNATPNYRSFIDVDSFIDYHLLVELTKNVDGFRFSTFFYKDRGGLVKMGPPWDWNLSFGNADGKQGWLSEHWLWPQLDDLQYSWFRRLFEDSDFAQRYVDRWAQLSTNVFAPSNILARIDQLAALLDEAQERNFEKWEILGRRVNPNWFIGDSFEEEISWMKQWITNRLAWVDKQFISPPVLNLGQTIALSATASEPKIYFTLDGTDPRAPGGSLSPAARLYHTPLPRSKGSRLFARVQSASRWSAPSTINIP